jgi:hypothetical protein
MNPISMLLGAGRTEAMSRVMMDASSRMNILTDKMLKAGYEIEMIGREMGKGELLDVMA